MMNYKIIYEDKDIIVCHKMAGLPVQTGKIGAVDLVSELKNYLTKFRSIEPSLSAKQTQPKEPYLGVVHRLDQPVEGVILFAKTQKAAGVLSKQLTTGIMNKCYYAVAAGLPVEGKEQGILVDYLMKDNKTNSSKAVPANVIAVRNIPKDAKEAKLEYTLVKKATEGDKVYALYDIHLLTGRHHQIRVQMANANMPLLGDKKYGNDFSNELSNVLNVKNVALCAYKLEFTHPVTQKKQEFIIKPEGKIFEQFLPELL